MIHNQQQQPRSCVPNRGRYGTTNPKNNPRRLRGTPSFGVVYLLEARLSQRVAMDDLASYFVEERSKVR
jgi:hypothetical protein